MRHFAILNTQTNKLATCEELAELGASMAVADDSPCVVNDYDSDGERELDFIIDETGKDFLKVVEVKPSYEILK